MARKIVITLRKGGSGKTTTAINLAAALHKKGKRVLLIDIDPQANATLAVGINPLTLDRHINHLFTDISVQPRDVIIQTIQGQHVLPSHPDLARTEVGMNASQVGFLRGILDPLEDDYDFIVMDTPPSDSYLTINALASADEAIIPLQAHFLALQGLSQALEQIEQVRRGLNPNLRVAGILATMVNQRTNISRSVLDQVRERYPDLVYPFVVDYSIKHSEANLYGSPIVFLDQFHPGSQAYIQLADTLL